MRFGSLFSGYGGLDQGVQSVLGGSTAWHCEIEPAPSRILAHHWPDVPNLGDITKVDWSAVEPVDVLTGGSPCQDLSHAGRRKGMTEGTRSNLWVAMREAIARLRPSLVVWENVRGAYSAPADSEMEPGARLLAAPDGGPTLRALGRVLGDLSTLGYDAQWVGVRAADAGAPHGRFRVFVFAWPATDTDDRGSRLRRAGKNGGSVAVDVVRPLAPADTSCDGRDEGRPEPAGQLRRPDAAERGDAPAADTISGGRDGWAPDAIGGPVGRAAAARSGEDATPDAGDAGSRREADHARRREPDAAGGAGRPEPGGRGAARSSGPVAWGDYEPAVRRWEHVTGRLAPAPTEPGKNGQPRLSPAFVEWMMGLPLGHVTDPAIGLTRNGQLKALGNGVVIQQAALATRMWLATRTSEVAA